MEKVQGTVACCELETIVLKIKQASGFQTSCLGGGRTPQGPPVTSGEGAW